MDTDEKVTIEESPRPETEEEEKAYFLRAFRDALEEISYILRLPGSPDLVVDTVAGVRKLVAENSAYRGKKEEHAHASTPTCRLYERVETGIAAVDSALAGDMIECNRKTSTWEDEARRAVNVLAREIVETTRWVDIIDLVNAIRHIRRETEQHQAEAEHLSADGTEKTDG